MRAALAALLLAGCIVDNPECEPWRNPECDPEGLYFVSVPRDLGVPADLSLPPPDLVALDFGGCWGLGYVRDMASGAGCCPLLKLKPGDPPSCCITVEGSTKCSPRPSGTPCTYALECQSDACDADAGMCL